MLFYFRNPWLLIQTDPTFRIKEQRDFLDLYVLGISSHVIML